jgi:hypothetical protein
VHTPRTSVLGGVACPPHGHEVRIPEWGLEGGGVCLPTNEIRHRQLRRKSPEVEEGTARFVKSSTGMEFEA